MFTGIVETAGEVLDATDDEGGRRLRVRAAGLDDLHHGQSISVSGVCLTVERFGGDAERDSAGGGGESAADDRPWFEVFLAAETVEKTYLGEVAAGDLVNIERAMAADGRFDGHLVQGHVDTTAEVTSVERVGDDWRFGVSIPEGYGRYIVDKGSITVDGISLTVAAREAEGFDIAIIPTTYDLTNLSTKAVGDPVHLEVDVVAKYVESMLDGYVERLDRA
ncbi:riboflavin synthase [Haloferacaceae archaeon DSL9]